MSKLLALSFLVSIIACFLIMFFSITDVTTVSANDTSYKSFSQSDDYQVEAVAYDAFNAVSSFAADLSKRLQDAVRSKSDLDKDVQNREIKDIELLGSQSRKEQNADATAVPVYKAAEATESIDKTAAATESVANTFIEKAELLMSGKKPEELFSIEDITPVGLVGVDDKKEILFEVKGMGYTFSLPFGRNLADGSVLSGLKLKGNSVIAVVFTQNDKITEVQWAR